MYIANNPLKMADNTQECATTSEMEQLFSDDLFAEKTTANTHINFEPDMTNSDSVILVRT